MDMFLRAAVMALLTALLGVVLVKQNKDISLLLTLAACTMIAVCAMGYLEPVMAFLERLEEQAGLDGSLMEILLKAVGIGMVGELAGLVCADAGNSALGKALQLLSAAVVLWMSIPLFQSLMDLISGTLGEI